MKQNEADLEILEVLIAESEAVNEGKDKQKKTNNSPEEEKNENDGDGDADSDADSVDMEAMRQGAEALTNNITMLSDIIANTKKEIAAAKEKADSELQEIKKLRRKTKATETQVLETRGLIDDELQSSNGGRGLALHARTGYLARLVLSKVLSMSPPSTVDNMLLKLPEPKDAKHKAGAVKVHCGILIVCCCYGIRHRRSVRVVLFIHSHTIHCCASRLST